MAALAAPPPAADQQLIEDALGRALDAGKTGPELLSALHAAAPHLEMAAMHSLLEDYKAKEDAKLFDLVAENYRDFFRIATSVEGSAEDAAATQAALLALEGEASKAAATAGVEQAKLEDELARRREKRREDREKDKVKRFASTLSDLEKRLADADVDVERAAHDALHLRAALDGAVTRLPTRAEGLDVNVKFNGGFEFTSDLAIFDLLDVRLVHGWRVDGENDAATAEVQRLAFRQQGTASRGARHVLEGAYGHRADRERLG